MSTHMIVAAGDIHGGSTVSVCPPQGVELDDGGAYVPSKAQAQLYKYWASAWDEVRRIRDVEQPETASLVLNGDMVDGNHHGTPQIVSPLESLHIRIAHKCLELEPLRDEWDGIHLIRGTETHTGKSGTLEEGLARVLKAEGYPMVPDPEIGTVSSFWRRIEVGGLLVDVRHHGRMGQRAHTRGPYARWYSQEIEWEHRLDGVRPPDIAIRSHLHKYEDSGRSHRHKTRVVSLPCWQLMTAFGHRIAAESMVDVGLVAIVIRDGRDEVIPILRDKKTARPKIVRI